MNALEIDPTGQLEKRLLGMLTTNHTFFMREFEHMEFLSRVYYRSCQKKSLEQKIWGFGARQLRVGKNHICWQC